MMELRRQDVPLAQAAEEITYRLQHGGIFLTTCTKDGKPNTMTIGWGGVGCFFNKPMVFVPVRTSRYTFHLLNESWEFTLSVPLHNMKAQLAFAGTMSGRDVDKFIDHGLTATQSLGVAAPIIQECELHLECRVVASPALTPDVVVKPMVDRWYPDSDMHTLFFGEIIHCYYTK